MISSLISFYFVCHSTGETLTHTLTTPFSLVLHTNDEIVFDAYLVGLMNFKEFALMSDKRLFISVSYLAGPRL